MLDLDGFCNWEVTVKVEQNLSDLDRTMIDAGRGVDKIYKSMRGLEQDQDDGVDKTKEMAIHMLFFPGLLGHLSDRLMHSSGVFQKMWDLLGGVFGMTVDQVVALVMQVIDDYDKNLNYAGENPYFYNPISPSGWTEDPLYDPDKDFVSDMDTTVWKTMDMTIPPAPVDDTRKGITDTANLLMEQGNKMPMGMGKMEAGVRGFDAEVTTLADKAEEVMPDIVAQPETQALDRDQKEMMNLLGYLNADPKRVLSDFWFTNIQRTAGWKALLARNGVG